jgi:hypothetical protein
VLFPIRLLEAFAEFAELANTDAPTELNRNSRLCIDATNWILSGSPAINLDQSLDAGHGAEIALFRLRWVQWAKLRKATFPLRRKGGAATGPPQALSKTYCVGQKLSFKPS